MRHQPDSRNSVSQFLDSLSGSSDASNGPCETYQKGKIFTRTMSGDFQHYRSDNWNDGYFVCLKPCSPIITILMATDVVDKKSSGGETSCC